MKYTLHTYRRCPYCIRTRILMHLKGVEYSVIEEPMREWTGWMQDWSRENEEKPRVPVLRYTEEDEGGRDVEHIMPESLAINLFLDARDGKLEFTPEVGSAGYAEMEKWGDWYDVEVKEAANLYKYGENRVFDIEKNDAHMQNLRPHIQKLEDHLSEHAYLVEDRLTLADIAVIPFIRQILRVRDGEFDFSDFPKTVAWVEMITETDWFKDEVMKKYPLALVGVW
ncbi:MAG: glutathione S-transferase [Candidatus Azotimanducaceae bacterium]|jgi:glutathione S-transferase